MTQPADVRAGIVTRFLGPTNHRPARVAVSDNYHGDVRRIHVSWDDDLNPAQNHAAAARAWLAKFNPDAELAMPGIDCGKGYAWTWGFSR
jgi:hypothetical protein